MIWISKNAKIIYLGVLLPIYLITAIWGIVKSQNSLVYLSIVLFAIFTLIIRKMAINEMKAVTLELSKNLEVQEYIKFYEYAVKCKFNSDTTMQMKSALLSGYLASGDFSKATPLFYEVRAYLSISDKPEKHINPLITCIDYLIYTNELNDAYALLIQLFECNKFLSDKFKNKAEAYNALNTKYLCATNQLSSIDEFYCVFEKTESMYTKIQLKYFLGNYYTTNNNISEAINQYNYVATHGKDLYVTRLAKSKISSITKTQSNQSWDC